MEKYSHYQLYQAIENAERDMESEEVKAIAVSLIDELKKHNLTYDQCYRILIVTRATLEEMSQLLRL